MADGTEGNPPEIPGEEDQGGGPVKTFLEHLEDLRWTLLKCAVAVFIGFLVCLSASNHIIRFLTWPLHQAQAKRTTAERQVSLILGTNQLAKFTLGAAPQFAGLSPRTNGDIYLRLSPVPSGTNWIMGLVPEPNPPTDATYAIAMDLSVFGPVEAFKVMLQIAMYGGFTVSAPFVIFFLAQFILPALHVHEKRFLYRSAGSATLLFLTGLAFCYFVMMVVTLSTTVSFANWLGFRSDTWKASEYISFMCWFMLGMGISFQLPLVLLTLVKIGLLDSAALRKFRAYFYVGILVIAAFVTPDGNPVTMILMALPLVALYEITVVIARLGERKRQASVVELE